MGRAEVAGDLSCVIGFVVATVLGVGGAERLDRLSSLPCHEAGQRARIEASAQEGAERDIADHLRAGRAANHLEDALGRLVLVGRDDPFRLARNVPIAVCLDDVVSYPHPDRKSTRLNSSHLGISYAVFCLKKKKETIELTQS